ncbi:ATP-citrate synthase, citrate-binding domain [Phytophthora cactorum]|nr:ATP-citrate synthase, citrate-binding domain [Phytophthora cactorum]
MSAKAIREFDGKRILSTSLPAFNLNKCFAQVAVSKSFAGQSREEFFGAIETNSPWLTTLGETKLVVKPDQLIKRRGKANLLLLNATWAEVQDWVWERINKPIQVETVTGVLTHFIVEPFIKHGAADEHYVCIVSNRDGEEILFHHEGGVDVGDVDAKAKRLQVGIESVASEEEVTAALLSSVEEVRKPILAKFLVGMLAKFRELHFVYMEINPIVLVGDQISVLDMAAKLDETANFLVGDRWGAIEFPPAFGRAKFPEEEFIQDLDSKTGASLKLTILNHTGRIWTMVAGGGASVVYADTIADLGYGHELANYGEYSGAPSETHTYHYAKTILDLMTRNFDERGKVLIIGGVPAEAQGQQVHIWVRRGGPNCQEGLTVMREVGEATGVPIEVFGPETHITAVVPMALGLVEKPTSVAAQPAAKAIGGSKPSASKPASEEGSAVNSDNEEAETADDLESKGVAKKQAPVVIQDEGIVRMNDNTRCIVYGLQQRAVQGMLDFDYLCKRKTPSVAALIFPFSPNHYLKFYWGTSERLIPVFQKLSDAVKKFPDVSVLINFSSFRRCTGAAVALISKKARELNVGIIGPATVGGIKPGCLRIGNTGGMLDNIVQSKLYRPGSVAYVSKSGGMSNELNNIVSQTTDGVYEGVAIGGDKYPGSTFIQHLLRYEANPEVKMMVLLGEVGGTDEFAVCRAIQSDLPVRGAVRPRRCCATGESETASAKNAALAAAGAIVPENFDQFGNAIRKQFDSMVASGAIVPRPEVPVPRVPMDYAWAKNLGLIRKPANFISSISDDRGEELRYAGTPISKVFEQDMGVGGVIGLLWFKRNLPAYASKFIEMVLMVTADHGPAVSGAHNTIVTARAGKDLISSLISGLVTIGPRFGGALDKAAEMFASAHDSGLSPADFVVDMRRQNKLIMGIGHRIKSLSNPDKRVTIIKEFAKANFPATDVLDFALEVEQVTTKKRSNLILNVDGCIAVCFVDLLRNCGVFTLEEANEQIADGCLNGLFVLGRSIGFIGHFLDQKRLKQPLYRHPWDDISYLNEEF